jgi:putative oxidoreductase
MLKLLSAWNERAALGLRPLGHVIDLVLRLDVANAFIRSGLVKVGNWDGTLYLFRSEYHVPLLPPEIAAWAGTFGELVFPPLLALGLAARFSALSLSIVNVVAVISYWHVLGDNEAALASHFYWGVLLLVTLTHGPGKLSLDYIIEKRLAR